jgi:hypothetical protein
MHGKKEQGTGRHTRHSLPISKKKPHTTFHGLYATFMVNLADPTLRTPIFNWLNKTY